MLKEVAIACPVGLGDLLVLSGAFEYLTTKYDRVNVPYKKEFYETASALFQLNPKINLCEITLDRDPLDQEYCTQCQGDVLDVGSKTYDRTISFSENYYRSIDIDYSVRWDFCRIKEIQKYYIFNRDAYDIKDPYIFVHDARNRGFGITKLNNNGYNIYRPEKHKNMFFYVGYILFAKQLHFIDSSFLHFIEGMELPEETELFFHEYAKPGSLRKVPREPICPSRKIWTIYPQDPICEFGEEDVDLDIVALSSDDVEIARTTVSKNKYFEARKRSRFLFCKKTIKLVNHNIQKNNFIVTTLILGIKGKIVRIVTFEPKFIKFQGQYNITFNPGDIMI